MPRYLISFDDGAMTFPEEELPDVAEAAHAVTREAQDAGVWVFAGGLHPLDEVRVVATDGTVTDGRESKAVLKRSASSCPTRPWATDRARRPTRRSHPDRLTPAFAKTP